MPESLAISCLLSDGNKIVIRSFRENEKPSFTHKSIRIRSTPPEFMDIFNKGEMSMIIDMEDVREATFEELRPMIADFPVQNDRELTQADERGEFPWQECGFLPKRIGN